MKNNKVVKLLIRSSLFISCGLFFVPFLTSCKDVISSQTITDLLIPDLTLFICHIFATVVLIVMAIWLVWKPTRKSIETRREYEGKTLQEAEDAKKDSFARLMEAEQKRLEAYQQAENIIEAAKEESYFNYDTVIEQAKIDAKKISDAAHDDAQTLINRLQETEDQKVVDIALFVSEQLLKKKITKKENEKFIKEFINSYNSKGEIDD